MKKLAFVWTGIGYQLLAYYLVVAMTAGMFAAMPVFTGWLVEYGLHKDLVNLYMFVLAITGVIFCNLADKIMRARTTIALRRCVSTQAVLNAWNTTSDEGVVVARYNQSGNVRVFLMHDLADVVSICISVSVIVISLFHINVWFSGIAIAVMLAGGSINVAKAKYLRRYVVKQHDLEERKVSTLSSRSNVKLNRYIKQQNGIILANAKIDITGYMIAMPLTTLAVVGAVVFGDISTAGKIVAMAGLFYQLDGIIDSFSIVQQSVTSFRETLKRF